MPVIIFGETAESLVHNDHINFPLDKYLAEFPASTDFPAEFLSLPWLFIPARLSTASPLALSAPRAQECRQVHLLPILCCTELALTLFLKGSGNDKWVIDHRGPFLLPDNLHRDTWMQFCLVHFKIQSATLQETWVWVIFFPSPSLSLELWN